jgi:ribose/xylose/arabinose/galactoside ABC-type transport system permease subunit
MSVVFPLIFWAALATGLFFSWKKPVFWPLLALALLLLFNQLFTDGFFHVEVRDGHLYGTLIDILNQGAKVMLLALGMTLIIATGGVDLSVGAIMAIAGAVLAQRFVGAGWSPGLSIVAALALALLAGAWNGLLVAYLRITPIVATLILMVAGRGMAQLITDGQIITFEHPTLVYLGNGFFLGLPFTLTLVLVMLGLTAALTRRTALGLFIEAVGDNETASHFTGLPAKKVKFLAYVFAGFCAGLAGLVAASNIKCADSNHAGLYLELDAILAAVIGGTALTGGRFYLAGSMIGALLIQTLTQTLYMRNVSADIAPVPKAIVILAVCLLQSPKLRERFAKLGFGQKGRAA